MQTREKPKNPKHVAAGQKAMRARWGPQRIVRLDELDPDTARLIRALLAQTEKAEPETQTPDSAQTSNALSDASDAA